MNPVGNSVNRPVGNAYHCQNPQFSGLSDTVQTALTKVDKVIFRSAEGAEAGILSRAWNATRAFVSDYIWEPLKSAYRATANACGRAWEATKNFFSNLFKKAEPEVEKAAETLAQETEKNAKEATAEAVKTLTEIKNPE